MAAICEPVCSGAGLAIHRERERERASGVMGGIDKFGTATADNSGLGTPTTVVTPDFSPGAVPIPPFVTAVFIIRVK